MWGYSEVYALLGNRFLRAGEPLLAYDVIIKGFAMLASKPKAETASRVGPGQKRCYPKRQPGPHSAL